MQWAVMCMHSNVVQWTAAAAAVAPSFLEWWEMMVLALPTYIYEPNVSELCICVALEWGIVV